MKKVMTVLACLALFGAFFTATVHADDALSNHELQMRIEKLEKKLGKEGGRLLEEPSESTEPADEMLSNQKLHMRIEQLEKKMGEEDGRLPDKWSERIELSGLIEVEAGYVSIDPKEGDSSDESDIAVATVELGVDAEITKHVLGHVLFLYEDGEDISVDEATITLSGEDVIPAYLTAGEMYVPFGNFESHMISDPLTLEIAETREAAIQVGGQSGGF